MPSGRTISLAVVTALVVALAQPAEAQPRNPKARQSEVSRGQSFKEKLGTGWTKVMSLFRRGKAKSPEGEATLGRRSAPAERPMTRAGESARVAPRPKAQDKATSRPEARPTPRPEAVARPEARPKPKLSAREALRRALETAKVRTAPFGALDYAASYGGEGPITKFRTGEGPNPIRYVWFHGAGQATENEMISRLANAFHSAGLNMEIYSMPYSGDGLEVAKELIRSSKTPVIVGGHSAGGGPTGSVLRALHEHISAVVTFNAGTPTAPGVPALHFRGENDGGSHLLEGVLPEKKTRKKARSLAADERYKWGGRDVVVVGEGSVRAGILRKGDHSARLRAQGDHDKPRASGSEATRKMNLAAARTMKAFLTEMGVQ